MPFIPWRKTSWKEKLGTATISYASSYFILGLLGGGWNPNILNQADTLERKVQLQEQNKNCTPKDLVYNADEDKNGRLNEYEIKNLIGNLIREYDAPFYRKLSRSHLGNFSPK